MSFYRVSKMAMVLGVAAGCTGLVRADWPGFRGPTHDGRSNEKISKTWPAAGPRQLWKVPSPGGFSSITVAAGRAFNLELRDWEGAPLETIVAREEDTGRELWAKALGPIKINSGGESGADGNKGGDGPRSTPAADADRVYTFSSRLVVECFDARTGNSLWRRDLVKENAGRNIDWDNAQSPVLDDGLVFVAGGGPGQSLLAFNAKDGQPVWKAFDEQMTHATCVPTTLLGQRQVIYFVRSGLLSIEPKTGRELWRFPFDYNVSTAASPVVAGDIVYCSAGYKVGAGAARISREGHQWKATQIYRFRGNEPLANHWSTPVFKDGYLYGMFHFKEYGKAPIKCVEAATGKVMWEKGGFGPGQLIIVDGQVLALSDDGQLVQIEATPAGYHELSRVDILDGKCWTMPSVSNGRVFARSSKEAVCLDLSLKSASR